MEKGVQDSQENTCARVSFLASGLQLIKKETLARVFSSEFCGISKNSLFTEHLWTTVSVFLLDISEWEDFQKQ